MYRAGMSWWTGAQALLALLLRTPLAAAQDSKECRGGACGECAGGAFPTPPLPPCKPHKNDSGGIALLPGLALPALRARRRAPWALTLAAALLLSPVAEAQGPGECIGGLCGTPRHSGGAGKYAENKSGGSLGGVRPRCWRDDPGLLMLTCVPGSQHAAEHPGDTYFHEDDADGDGWEDATDNCPGIKNKSQTDSDGDTIGDSCDNCPSKRHPTQADIDGDGEGDACDPDIDGDGLANAKDNCKLHHNQAQHDADQDGQGDACDDDDDGDGVLDAADNCPLVANPAQDPGDPTKHGSACDRDTDADKVLDSVDNCIHLANADQKDLDGDGRGDACDADRDGDSKLNTRDNCPGVANKVQQDADRDGQGDACDDRYCFVVHGDAANCLDPARPFRVYAPDVEVSTGEAQRLRLFANRRSLPLRYRWTVVQRPEGSGAEVINPEGRVTTSTSWEYFYHKNNIAQFEADEPGLYKVKVWARPVLPDLNATGGPREASYVVTVTAEGPSLGGCSLVRGGRSPAPLALGLLLLLVALRRR